MASDSLDSQDRHRYDGEWTWIDCPPNDQYGFRISGNIGICIKSNSPKFAIGDIILNIERMSQNVFFGKQIFKDGNWVEVSGRLEDNMLHMQGGGWNWKLQKVE